MNSRKVRIGTLMVGMLALGLAACGGGSSGGSPTPANNAAGNWLTLIQPLPASRNSREKAPA